MALAVKKGTFTIRTPLTRLAGLLDDANRANENPIGGNWSPDPVADFGNIQIVDNEFRPTGASDTICSAYWNAAQFGASQEAWLKVGDTGPGGANNIALLVRIQQPGPTTGDAYFLGCNGSAWSIYRYDNGAATQLGTSVSGNVLVPGDEMLFRAVGATLKGYRWIAATSTWVEVISRDDQTYTGGGYIGMRLDRSPTAEEFGGGTIVPKIEVRGVGFKPRAVLFAAGKATADQTWEPDSMLSQGFAARHGDESSSSGAIGTISKDGLGSADAYCSDVAVGRCLVGYTTAGGFATSVDYLLKFNAWDDDGFDLELAELPSADFIGHYLALGGSDVSDAQVNLVQSTVQVNPGTQDVTVRTGFGQPDLIFVLSTITSAPQTAGMHSFGVAKSDTERASAAWAQTDGATNTLSRSVLQARAFTGLYVSESPLVEWEFDLSARSEWPTDGFEVNYVDPPNNLSRHWLSLALKGTFQSKIGLADSPVADGNQDIDAGFAPKALLAFSDDLPAHVGADNSHADGHGLSVGMYDGTTQGLIDIQSDDGNTTMVEKNISDATRILRLTGPGATPSDLGKAVTSFPGGNTVRLAWTGLGATARQFAYLVLGDAPGGGGSVHTLSLSGSITPAGALSRRTRKALAGATSPAGALLRAARKSLSGAVSPVGSLRKNVGKRVGGAIAPTGTLATQVVRVIRIALGGSITPAGTLRRRVGKSLAGTTSPAGALLKRARKQLAGAIAPAGSVRKRIGKRLGGLIAPVGALVAQVFGQATPGVALLSDRPLGEALLTDLAVGEALLSDRPS